MVVPAQGGTRFTARELARVTDPPSRAGKRVPLRIRRHASFTSSGVAGTSLIICDGSGPTPR